MLRLTACFRDMQDTVSFSYRISGQRTETKEGEDGFTALGNPHKLYFTLDHFTGCRAGLFMYSTIETGGAADFADFKFEAEE